LKSIGGLEGQLDFLKVETISAEEIATSASRLCDRWRMMESEARRELVEIVTEKMVSQRTK
jgi:hypothetical protein